MVYPQALNFQQNWRRNTRHQKVHLFPNVGATSFRIRFAWLQNGLLFAIATTTIDSEQDDGNK